MMRALHQRSRIAGAFKEFDINGDGVIDHSEFTTGVRYVQMTYASGYHCSALIPSRPGI